jgi:hypothetical protein
MGILGASETLEMEQFITSKGFPPKTMFAFLLPCYHRKLQHK